MDGELPAMARNTHSTHYPLPSTHCTQSTRIKSLHQVQTLLAFSRCQDHIYMYKDGGGFFEVIKGRRGSNKRQKQEWHRFISFSQQSTLVQNEEDGRICIGRVVGGQQRSSGVDLSCRETFLWRRHTLLEVKWGKEGREGTRYLKHHTFYNS